jgi:hypothetical protein
MSQIATRTKMHKLKKRQIDNLRLLRHGSDEIEPLSDLLRLLDLVGGPLARGP